MASVAAATSPSSAVSRNLRTAVLSEDLTALLRRRAFSFCLLRLIWDLMFATRKASLERWFEVITPGSLRPGVCASAPAKNSRAFELTQTERLAWPDPVPGV